MIDYLRLLVATALVLLPGRLVARSLGQSGTSATLAWGLAALALAWALVFAVHGTIWLALGALAAIGVAAAAARWLRRLAVPAVPRGHGAALAIGFVLGLLLWHVAGAVVGDGLFHVARVRKLVDLGDLHLRTVDEFVDGGLHPGYAFPLWHGFLALVAKISGLDPTVVVAHEPSLLAPLACAVAWEAGVAVFGSSGAGFAVLAAQVGLFCFAAGHGGSFAVLAQPATAARQLLVPAGIALFFGFVAAPRVQAAAALGVLFGALALIHVTYAIFALVPLAAFTVVRFQDARRAAVALAAAVAPTLLVVLWLRPLADETVSRHPGPVEQARAIRHYAGQVDVLSAGRYRLAPDVVTRTGAIAVAALLFVPLAALAVRRRRWAAFVLAGTVAVLALMLVPALFTRFSDAVSLSQSRRAAGFLPFAFAFAGGLALVARSRLVLPLALAAGIAFELAWPGDFAYGHGGGPGLVTWFALVAGAVGLGVGVLLFRRAPPERYGLAAAAAALFVLPVAVHGFARWSPRTPRDTLALSTELRRELAAVPPRSVVIAPLQTSYRILAAAPVYVVAAPPTHVADTRANRPYRRARDVERWLATHDPAIPRKYGATWAVVGGRLRPLQAAENGAQLAG